MIFDGMIHLLTVPQNLMALVGLGLVVGLGGRAGWWPIVAGYLVALFAACLLVASGPVPGVLWHMSLVLALWLGLIAATDLGPAPWLIGILAGAVGFAAGLDVMPLGRVDAVTLAQVVAGAALHSTLVWAAIAFMASLATVPWQRVGVRIAGSWLAAIAALMLALVFAG